MKLTRARQFHTRVEIQNDAAALRHEIDIGETRKRLKHARLILSQTRAPFSFETLHNHLCKLARCKNLGPILLHKNVLKVLILVELRFVVVIFLINFKCNDLDPGLIGIIKELLNQKSTGKASLISGVIAIRLAVISLIDAEDLSHTVSQEERLRGGIIRDVNKELILNNIKYMCNTKSLRKCLNVFDRGIGIHKWKGIQNGGMELREEQFRL